MLSVNYLANVYSCKVQACSSYSPPRITINLRGSSIDTAVLDLTLGLELLELGNLPLTKQNLSKQQTESLVLDSISTTFSS